MTQRTISTFSCDIVRGVSRVTSPRTVHPADRIDRPCNGPAKGRAPDNSIDMGTAFDCFDVLSHTSAPGLDAEQQRWRQTLVDAMAQQGFRNYHKEWWHFIFKPERYGRSFDVPVSRQRR